MLPIPKSDQVKILVNPENSKVRSKVYPFQMLKYVYNSVVI